MRKILKENFFDGATLKVAEGLLGKFLVRKVGRRTISGMITEVEAYCGPKDRASHAAIGRTERTKVMFGEAGQWYVYLIYGMHNCLNIVTERKDFPAAVLIRSVAVPVKHSHILQNVRMFEVKGPGRVCKKFRIDRSFNKKPADKATGLWIEDRGVKIKKNQVKKGKRIGVDYAGAWKHKLWRFYL